MIECGTKQCIVTLIYEGEGGIISYIKFLKISNLKRIAILFE